MTVSAFFSAVFFVFSLLGVMTLPGCKMIDLGLFTPSEEKLEGERSLLVLKKDALFQKEMNDLAPPLPEPRMNDSWSQSGGNHANAMGHLSLTHIPVSARVVEIVQGSSGQGRLSSPPLIYQDHVFIFDIEGNLVSFPVTGGPRNFLYLYPETSKLIIHSGGLAVENDVLYVSTGYGTLHALDPMNGTEFWRFDSAVPFRSAPTVKDRDVFVVTKSDRLIVFDGLTGAQKWDYQGLEVASGLLGLSGPAVAGSNVVVPFSSGEVVAFERSDGKPVWLEKLFRSRYFSGLGPISNVAAHPVIDKGIVYSVSASGFFSAVELSTGFRLWRKGISGSQRPSVSGKAVYLVDLEGRLAALDRSSGESYWVTRLSTPDQELTWSGPVLAEGLLWLVSSDGLVLAVDARSGNVFSHIDLAEPVYLAPVIANGRIYVLTNEGSFLVLE
ncbi:MAG: PQQ-binding-like beta-propeller repeat protein [Alphaproteobacteria bacterium]|nr:PQQ-binding-like beta-propeller repeat protein [Alphaproteobacteria bacterium]